MKWKKIGKIFDPADYDLPNGCVDYAQSPQALVFDDFIRIYFSTRSTDPRNGKYVSHVAFADFKKDLSGVLRCSTHTVVELGARGCFDEHGIFPFNVLKVANSIYGYSCGWSRRFSVPIDTSIGLAISEDHGFTFKKIGSGPILTSSLKEPFLIGDPCVRLFDGQFHMWYIFGTQWKPFPGEPAPERIYKVAHAISEDGVAWDKEEGRAIIQDRLSGEECQAHPTVIRHDDGYHMYFCYRYPSDFRTNPARSYRIGHARSENLTDWQRDDPQAGIDVSSGGWDSAMLCYPHLFVCEAQTYLLYNGNEFGRHGFGAAVLE